MGRDIFVERRVGQDLSQVKETAMGLPGKGEQSQRSQAAGRTEDRVRRKAEPYLSLRMAVVSGVL